MGTIPMIGTIMQLRGRYSDPVPISYQVLGSFLISTFLLSLWL